MNWITSLLLPSWVVFTFDHFWVIATSVTLGYLIGKEGGFWMASKRFFFIVSLAVVLVATGAFVKENLPDWAKQAKLADEERQASKGWTWSYREGK